MSPPIARPFPRFIADTAQDPRPYGDWEQQLTDAFASACAALASEAGGSLDTGSLRFFPERAWGGRTYVPIAARADAADGEALEFFGHVSFQRDDSGSPLPLHAEADFTDVTADENPDWQVDLNDDVIGEWRADGGRGGEITLIWGTPLVRGAIAATAELDGEVLDQAAVTDGRFTLIAVDAVHGFGDELFLAVKLWDRRFREIASESLYEPAGDEDEAAVAAEAPAESAAPPAE